jgi:hypothetical protein
MRLRLVTDQPDRTPTAAKPPPLRLIEGGGVDPETVGREWRYTPTGRLLPRTHRFDRITLSTHRATREWREVGAALDRATDAIAAAAEADLDDALENWCRAATAVLACSAVPLEGSHALRTKVAPAAIAWGNKLTYGGIHNGPETVTEWAFAVVDHAIFSAEWRRAQGPRSPSRKPTVAVAKDAAVTDDAELLRK